MTRIEYDFREGLDGSKRVYYDKRSCNCGEFWGYLGYLLATWIWAAGWFALFLYAWLEDRVVTFWVFIGVWFAFMFFLIFGFFVPNLVRFYREEAEEEKKLQAERDEKERKLREAQMGTEIETLPNRGETEKDLVKNEK